MALVLTLALGATSPALAQDMHPEGEAVCRAEAGEDIGLVRRCYDDWVMALDLVHRYARRAGVVPEAGESFASAFSRGFGAAFTMNPFKKNPFKIFGACSRAGLYSGQQDYRKVWACIAEHDPDAARWDTI